MRVSAQVSLYPLRQEKLGPAIEVLRRLVREAAGKRLGRLRCRTALLPAPLPTGPMRMPLGDIVGVAAELRRE